jgi:hypothetical protein
MEYGFSINLYDMDGDCNETCILAHIGDNTILKFKDADELEKFANQILGSLKEIKENI